MEKQFPEIVKNRRSIRNFSGEHIPDEIIDQLLSLAAYAPSSWEDTRSSLLYSGTEK